MSSPGIAPGVTTSTNVIEGDGSTLSVAVAVPVPAGVVSSPNSTEVSIGTVITGSVVSVMVMV